MNSPPLSKAVYLQRVTARARTQPCAEERLARLAALLGTPAEEARLLELVTELAGQDPARGHEGLCVIVPLESARGWLHHPTFTVRNWHYDRTAASVLLNLKRGRHESLSAVLHQLYVNSMDDTATAAERFLDEGLGWFRSSTSLGRLLKGRAVRMTAQERVVFGGIPVFEE